jgi:hypothetical protein
LLLVERQKKEEVVEEVTEVVGTPTIDVIATPNAVLAL